MRLINRVAKAFLHLPKWGIRGTVVGVTLLISWILTSVFLPISNPHPVFLSKELEFPVSRSSLPTIRETASTPNPTQTPSPSLQPPTNVVPTATLVMPEALALFPPLQVYEASLRPEQVSLLQELSHLPRYEIEVELLPDLQSLKGKASVAVMNSSSSPWTTIVFRLQANLPFLISNIQVQTVQVNGQLVSPIETGSTTVLTIPLDAPLEPGEWTKMDLSWQLQYYRLNDLGTYVRMGSNQDMINLPHFYPELAVFDPGAPGTNSEGWWIAEVPLYSDIRFHESALMRVTATMPDTLVAVGSGYHTNTLQLEDGRSRHHWVTGPVRGFVLEASPSYLVTTYEVDGVSFSSYYHAEDEVIARQALDMARYTLQAFEQLWGTYPYSHLTIVSSPLNDSGMEYSNLIQIGVLLYRNHPYNAEYVVAHEVAHQWMHLQVHNDPVHFPSLDEGLAELAYVILLKVKDPDYYKEGFVSYWRSILLDFEASYSGVGPWWRAYPYQDLLHYYWVHYTRPAVLLDEIWSAVGDPAFNELLRDYIQDNRFQIVKPVDLELVLQSMVTEDQLVELKEAWRIPASPQP